MAQQKVDIRVPVELDSVGREIVGRQVVDFIVQRTQQGLNINNKPFPGYSESYKESEEFAIAGKSSTVDLTLTGDMLTELRVLSHSPGIITIGYTDGTEENERAEWHRFPKPNKNTGALAPKRDFLGISEADLKVIVDRQLRATDQDNELESRAEREARAILNRTLRIFGGN